MDVTPKQILVTHCSLVVSRCNGFPCHWIKTSKAERVSLSQCNDLLTIKSSRTVPLSNSPHDRYVNAHHSSPAAMGTWRSNRWRRPLAVVVTKAIHGQMVVLFLNPRATEVSGSTRGRLGSLFRTALSNLS